MNVALKVAVFFVMFLSCEVWCLAAPSLPIVRPLVSPALSFTGPSNDMHAAAGQWFQNLTTSNLESRTHEFYDNVTNNGGGTWGHLAISGVVVNVETVTDVDPPFDLKIVSFDIMATVYNDTASQASGTWISGTNSHSETLNTTIQYSNTLRQVILTVDFATCGKVAANAANEPAFTDFAPYIVATNNDYASWFCWNTARPDLHQPGDFFVPGWNFGDLLPGQSTNRLLHFVVLDNNGGPDGITSGIDPRYNVIINSYDFGKDILINRSSSLKISTWISTPAEDDGTDYPVDVDHYLGNASVFHNTITAVITEFKFQASPPTVFINSLGGSSNTLQILQSSTNLTSTNWANIATNLSPWPAPQTNYWTNAFLDGSVNFFRIIQ